MRGSRFYAFIANPLPALLLLLVLTVPFATTTEADMKDLLPPVSCSSGWTIEGKPLIYDRDTLSDRIDGEAELFFPYGFDRMVAARYASKKNPGIGMDVEIYRTGSLLDAFGIFASYRQKDGRSLSVGADSNLSSSQVFLYQDRYFVHIQMTGADAVDEESLAECARMVAAQIPGNMSRPHEILPFDKPEIVKGSERYLPQSLLGYDFLTKGIMADAVVKGNPFQVFLLLGSSSESTAAIFDRYRSQLTHSTTDAGRSNERFLEGDDPLYGPVIVLKQGDCLTGALKFGSKMGVRAFLESVCRR